MWSDMGNMHWGWVGLGAVHMVLFWGFLILAILVLAKWLFGKNPETNAPRDKAPLEILKERYARGELERDEFEQRRRDLEL